MRSRFDEKTRIVAENRVHAEADLRLCQGIRAERSGHRREAALAYRAFLAIPAWRRSASPDPIIDRFIRWRISQLPQIQEP